MSKYEPLSGYLGKQDRKEVPIDFAGVERIIGAKLPPSAFKFREWWANEQTGHSQAKSWLSAGYRTARVDMEGRRLVFERVGPNLGGPPSMSVSPQAGGRGPSAARRHPAFGALKGTFRLDPATDFAAPAMPEWAETYSDPSEPKR